MTLEGTDYFEHLNGSERKGFYEKLRKELANAIPVSPERITSNEKIETDSSVTPKQTLLSINIEEDKTKRERTVNLAMKDLDTLIRHKAITVIESGETSRYLDSDYGYKPNRKNFIFVKIICFKKGK